MAVCDAVLPYKFHKRMTTNQLEYVVFVLVEKYREQYHNDLIPNWWPENVDFYHPMVGDRRFSNFSKWKTNLLAIIENYYKFNGHSSWFRDLLQKTLTDSNSKYVHLISDTIVEDQTSQLKNVIKKKARIDFDNVKKQTVKSKKTDYKLRIKESALLKLIPQPVVILCDVIKYPKKEDFLRNFNLMKTDKMLVHAAQYKLRRNNGSRLEKKTDKDLSLNGYMTQPKLSSATIQQVMPQCFVQLNTNETKAKKKPTTKAIKTKSNTRRVRKSKSKNSFPSINKIDKSLVNKSSSSSLPNFKKEPPFLILTPVSSNNIVCSDSEKKKKNSDFKEFTSKKRHSEPNLLNFLTAKHFYSLKNKSDTVKKVPLKKTAKKNIIKVKWLKPKTKMRFSV